MGRNAGVLPECGLWGDDLLIFVSVGTQKFQMNRLIEAVDRLVQNKVITERVVIQKGHSTYEPKYCDAVDFYEYEELNEKIRNASMLICHAGVGTILTGLKNGKKVIVMPRYRRYGEHVDDHQVEIAKAFAESGYVKMVREAAELPKVLKQAESWEPLKYVSNTEHFLDILIGKLKEYG